MKTSNQNLKLSTAGKVIVSLSLAYAGSAAVAANIEAIGGTSVTQSGKVDVVNIVAPNQQGLSHNQYNKYNVSKHGAVLNNSLTDGNSQLAGSLKANTNFGNKAASVILNEVVSKNPSLILGKQEVFGMAADYVLANPNGITHKGGSIINAPRASLVVGKAEIANGQIAALRTGDKNSAAVLAVEGGLEGGKVLDLIAPKVVVKQNAKVAASESVNLLAGNNKVNYVDGTVEVFEQAANAPVLDGQVFGSINSGAIRIHATDKRATLSINNQSGSSLNASEDLEVKSAGNLNMRAAKLSAGNNMLLSSENTTIDGVVSEKTQRTGSSGHASNHAVRVSQDKIKGQVKEAENAKKSAERHASNLLNAYNKALASAQSARSTADQAKGAADAARAKANQARDAANAAEQAANADRRNSKLRSAARNARNAANRANSEANRLENIARTKENDARAKSNTADREREKFVVAENAAVNAIAALESARIAAANVQNTGNIRIDMNNVFTTEAGNRTVQSYTGTSLTAKNLLTFDSANDVNIKGASVNAKNLLVRAENLNTGSEKTVNRSASNVDRVKGLWFDRINESSSNETLHDTNIKVGDTAILDMRNTVNLVSTNLDVAKDVNINAAKAVKMSGAVETDVQKRRQDKKNESAALQTGYAAQDSSMQTYHATNIQAGGNVLLKANEAVNLVGAKVQAGSTMLVETKHIGLDVQGTTDSAKRDDKYKMWGGLAGAREGLNDQTDETLHGAALISKGTVTLNAENDVRIRGSAVKGTEGAYVNAIGKTEISHVLASSNSLNRQRVGTIFNITKDRTHKESNIQTVTGSTLKSDADLSVSSGKDIALLGSKLEAARNVTLQSYEGDIGVVAAAAHNQHYSSSFNIRGKVSGNANVEKLEATGGVGLVFTKETNR
ncbi:MAG: hemagglutinin repeat-containing protein, partial [Conchiformibius sp.]|nr:hemagglutinin repeat-containing protein [Conchiformibius sp.]